MGRGKRAGSMGAYLLACYDPSAGRWQPICKLGTGFSDEELERWTRQLAPAAEAGASATATSPAPQIDLGGARLPPALVPHVWLQPSVVWEISAAEISLSPTYRAAAGMVDELKGLALRFPRFVRERPDKTPRDATTGALPPPTPARPGSRDRGGRADKAASTRARQTP